MRTGSGSIEKRTTSDAELSFGEDDERSPKRVHRDKSGFDNLRSFRVQANGLAILSDSEGESSTDRETDSDSENEPFDPRDHYLLMPARKAELVRKAAGKAQEKASKRKQRKAIPEARLRKTGPVQSPLERLPAELIFKVMTHVEPEDLQNLNGTCLESVHEVWSNWSHALLVSTLETQYPGFLELFGIMPEYSRKHDELMRTEEQKQNLVDVTWVLYIAHWADRSNQDAEAAVTLQQMVAAIEQGQWGYWNLLRDLSDHVDRDLDALDQIAGKETADTERIRAATLLLWRLKWPKVTVLMADLEAGQEGLSIGILSTVDQARTVSKQPTQVQNSLQAIFRTVVLYLDSRLGLAKDGLNLILEGGCTIFSGNDNERPARLSALLLWLDKLNTGYLTAQVIVSGVQNLVDISEATPNLSLTRRFLAIKIEYQILLRQKLEYERHGIQAIDTPPLADLGKLFCKTIDFEIGVESRPADDCWSPARKLVLHQDRIQQKLKRQAQSDSGVPNPLISGHNMAQYIEKIEEDD